MRTVRVAALLLLCAFPLSAARPEDRAERERTSRHVIVTAEHPLLPAERQELAVSGLKIVRELGGNRYIGRISNADASFVSTSIREIGAFVPQEKIDPSVYRAQRGSWDADVQVVFQPDVDYRTAARAIRDAGGNVQHLLATDFALPNTIAARVSPEALDLLANRDEVLSLHGLHRVIQPHNAVAARLSHVDVVQAAPYSLSGKGVVIGVWDVGSVQASHPEFEGRVIAEDLATVAIADHPTHVTGTITAKGINPDAKGMAPGATVHQFNVNDGFLESKKNKFEQFGILTDNNSWGYVLGWNFDDARSLNWAWYDDIEDFGNYAPETAGVDKLTRSSGTLSIYSAGNDDNDAGPSSSPFAHYHDDGTTVFCFSSSGSGTDCPATPCSKCEVGTVHPQDGPFRTMTLVGAAKNAIAVGAVNVGGFITGFSSRGPTTDGRIKPDVVAKGFHQVSTFPTNQYNTLQGTSMAAPVVTGITALLIEQWRKTHNGADPGPEMLRGLLIHGAVDTGNVGPDYTYGWGLVDAKASVDTILADAPSGTRIRTGRLAQGTSIEYRVGVSSAGRFTLVWSDPENIPYPGATLINDLDLLLLDDSGRTFSPWVLNPDTPSVAATTGTNHLDNVEQVVLSGVPAGTYTVRVTGSRVSTTAPQTFVLLSDRDLSDGRVACLDPFEPNDTAASAWGRLPNSSTLNASICSDSDLDFYRFDVDRSGQVKVTISATDVPLRATLTAPGVSTITADITAGTSQTLTAQAGSGSNQVISPITFTLQIAPLGKIADPSKYTVRAVYPSSQSNHRRTVHR